MVYELLVQMAARTAGKLMLLCRFADYKTTRPQDYKWLPPWAQLLLRRLRDYKTTSGCRLGLSYCFADYETTRLQVAAAPLVVSLTSCLGVAKRSQNPLSVVRCPLSSPPQKTTTKPKSYQQSVRVLLCGVLALFYFIAFTLVYKLYIRLYIV